MPKNSKTQKPINLISLQQVFLPYTPVFFLFECEEHEYTNIIKLIDYVIVMVRDLREWQVSFDLDKKSICCSL